MVFVGINVAKDKHDCFIISSEGEVLAEVFTITNNKAGFECLLQKIRSCAGKSEKIKVGLEATGHYSYNILGFLLDNGLDSVVINPLHTNLYRKSLSLRKTKTDRVDARTIAAMLMTARAMKLTRLAPTLTGVQVASLLSEYTDASGISDYAKASVAACIDTGVVLGRPNNTVASNQFITRAEVAVIIERMLQKSNLI